MQQSICEATTCTTLRRMGYNSRRCHRVPLISTTNRKKRLQYARAHQNWRVENGKNVAWSHESRFLLKYSDGRVRIWRKQNENIGPSCLFTTVQAAGGGVMVWRVQYNASCHKARIISNWFLEHDNEFTVLKWPPQSADLNPIEHLWDVVERELRALDVHPTNLHQLQDAILCQCFSSHKLNFYNQLIFSSHQACKHCTNTGTKIYLWFKKNKHNHHVFRPFQVWFWHKIKCDISGWVIFLFCI